MLAHLVERLVRNQEVLGSSPRHSTIQSLPRAALTIAVKVPCADCTGSWGCSSAEEQVLCKHKVVGSIPTFSTILLSRRRSRPRTDDPKAARRQPGDAR